MSTHLADQPRYYVLVAACVLARNVVWLRKASLAAALLLPATASLHAIVLASMHINGQPLPHAQPRGPLSYANVPQTIGELTWAF